MSKQTRLQSLRRFMRQANSQVWNAGDLAAARPRTRLVARVIMIAYEGIMQNKLLSRAASLSYSALLALGPLVGIIVLFSSTLLPDQDPKERIKGLLLFVAPTLGEYIETDNNRPLDEAAAEEVLSEAPPSPETSEAPAIASTSQVEPDDPPPPDGLAEDRFLGFPTARVRQDEDAQQVAEALDVLIDQIVVGTEESIGGVSTAGAGIATVISFGLLLFIGIQMLTSVETTLNDIWGVRRGRVWSQRVISYYFVITLGGLLAMVGIGLLSASNISAQLDDDQIPFSETVREIVLAIMPLISAGIIVAMLTAFYMFFPNTKVRPIPAVLGALTATIALVAVNTLSIFYSGQVIRSQQLYGSLAIIPILMLGLWFFWVCVLLGGQITFAVQNVGYFANQKAWSHLSPRAREIIAASVLLTVCRRFAACQPPARPEDLNAHLRVPGNILNEAVQRLSDMGYITAGRQATNDGDEITTYQPARPLGSITLAGFAEAFEQFGGSGGVEGVVQTDPLLKAFSQQEAGIDSEIWTTPLDKLLDKFPAEEGARENRADTPTQAEGAPAHS